MFIRRLAAAAGGPVRLGRTQRRTEPDLRTVQVVEGSSEHIAAMVTVLERGGCVVDSIVDLGEGRWQITARSPD